VCQPVLCIEVVVDGLTDALHGGTLANIVSCCPKLDIAGAFRQLATGDDPAEPPEIFPPVQDEIKERVEALMAKLGLEKASV
jgi:hypothetical protein